VRSFELAKVETLFSKDEGPITVQLERLERLGFLERVILENPDGSKTSHLKCRSSLDAAGVSPDCGFFHEISVSTLNCSRVRQRRASRSFGFCRLVTSALFA
jgi:hypothetical protein